MLNYLLYGFGSVLLALASTKFYLKYLTYDNSEKDPDIDQSPSVKRHLARQRFKQLNGKIKLKKNTSHLYRPRMDEDQKLDLNFLKRPLNINTEENWVWVDGLTTYRDLVKYTMKYNKIPLVVPEFSSLTVGGVMSGVGIESSSFKYGLTYDTVLEYEVLCGDGEIRTASPTENPDLFKAIPNSYGSFGYIISAKLKIIDAKSYVMITPFQFNDIEEAVEFMDKYYDSEVDFVDGIILGPNNIHIAIASMCDILNNDQSEAEEFLESFKYDIYYRRVTQDDQAILMKLEDYFWRYDYNSFFLGGIFENNMFRYFMGEELRSDNIKKIGESRLFNSLWSNKRASIVNDLGIELEKLPEFLEWYDQEISVYPVWLCPVLTRSDTYFFEPKDKKIVDFGIGFGVNKENTTNDPHAYEKLIDQKMAQMGARKGLYSNVFLTQEQFWDLYGPKEKYLKLKAKYDPNDRFYNLYQKTVCGI